MCAGIRASLVEADAADKAIRSGSELNPEFDRGRVRISRISDGVGLVGQIESGPAVQVGVPDAAVVKDQVTVGRQGIARQILDPRVCRPPLTVAV